MVKSEEFSRFIDVNANQREIVFVDVSNEKFSGNLMVANHRRFSEPPELKLGFFYIF